VISQQNGQREANSNYLGAAGTFYPRAFGNRGMEANDSYIINGNQLTVNMQVTEPGDWIRVITASHNTVHLIILTAWRILIGGSGLPLRGRSG